MLLRGYRSGDHPGELSVAAELEGPVDAVKSATDALREIVYDVVGLLLPAAALIAMLAYVISADAGARVIAYAEAHAWLTVAGAYLLGNPLQAISRPVTRVLRLVARAAGGALPWLAHRVGWNTGERTLRRGGAAVAAFLTGRHAGPDGVIGTANDTFDGTLDIKAACAAQWRQRLGLAETMRLTPFQVDALCYSVLQRRESIDRFRAAASLCRAMAAVVALAGGLHVWVSMRNATLSSPTSLGMLAGFGVLCWGFSHREDLYERVRTEALMAQTLVTGVGPAVPTLLPPAPIAPAMSVPLATVPEASRAVS